MFIGRRIFEANTLTKTFDRRGGGITWEMRGAQTAWLAVAARLLKQNTDASIASPLTSYAVNVA